MFHASLAFTSSGLPRLIATLADANNNVSLHYFEGSSTCSNSQSWTDTSVVAVGTWLRLRLDSADRPRILYFAGPLINNPDANKMFYSACDTNCTQPGNWRRAPVGAPDKSGSTGVDLSLDARDVPHIVYDSPISQQLEYAVCNGDCATPAAWTTSQADDAIPQAADPALRSQYKASYCRYGLGFIDPALEPVFNVSIFAGQQAHLALGPSGQAFVMGDYSATVNCGDGNVRPVVIIPAVYLPR